MADPPPPSDNPDDYSAAATLIPFPRPIPLVRGPIKAGPSSGPYLLAFQNPHKWAEAYQHSKTLITSQCESGARIGCSVSASAKCQPPWWKTVLGIHSEQDFRERERCEEREMEACVAAAAEKCGEFAKERCGKAFASAWVGGRGLVDRRDVFRLVSGVCFGKGERCGVSGGVWGVDESWSEFRRKLEVSCVRGRDLLGSDAASIEEYLSKSG